VEQLKMAVDLNPTQGRYGADLTTVEENIRQAPGGLLKSNPIEKRR
jgi:hypothetical protein